MTGLLYLPVVVFLFLAAMHAGARAGIAGTGRFIAGWDRTDGRAKAVAFVLVISAGIHLALVPQHLQEDATLAGLFVLDAVALAALAIGVFVIRRWRIPAVLLLAAGIGAYVFYIATGREDADAVGVITKLLEVAGIFLALVARSQPAAGSLPGSVPVGITVPRR